MKSKAALFLLFLSPFPALVGQELSGEYATFSTFTAAPHPGIIYTVERCTRGLFHPLRLFPQDGDKPCAALRGRSSPTINIFPRAVGQLLSSGPRNVGDYVEPGAAFSEAQFDTSGVTHDAHGAINDVLQTASEGKRSIP